MAPASGTTATVSLAGAWTGRGIGGPTVADGAGRFLFETDVLPGGRYGYRSIHAAAGDVVTGEVDVRVGKSPSISAG